MRYSAHVSPPYDDWSTRHSVAANARRTADLVNALAGEDGWAEAGVGTRRSADGGGHRDEGGDAGVGRDAGARAPDVDARARDAVAAVLRSYGEAEPFALSADGLADLRAAARLLREVFAAEHVDEAAARLNRLLAAGTGPLRLTSHGGASPWHPHLDGGDDAPWAEWFLASSCMALAVLVWDRQRPPGGVCASPSCPNVYVTEGRGPNRRYCSRRCATRERVAAHRARAAAPAEPVQVPSPVTPSVRPAIGRRSAGRRSVGGWPVEVRSDARGSEGKSSDAGRSEEKGSS